VVALAIVTLGVTGALALRSVLAADARSDRARVLAEYHRGNAEELIDFILGDLHAKLVEVGKLDLLDTAATKIRTYYDERGATSPEDALRFARLHLERGDILVERRSLEAARAEYAHALTWSWAATFGSGATAAVLRTRADTYNRLGEIAAQDGDFDAALRAHREQLAASAQLVALAPDDVRAAQDLNISRMVIADDLMELGEAAQAITALEAARAAASTHDDAEGRRQRFLIEDRLALLLAERGDRAGALGAARAALGLAEAQRDPDDVNTLLALALAHGRVGDALGSAGDHAGAQDAYRASRGLLEALVAHDPSNNTWQDERLYAYLRLANAQLAAGDPQAAAATARAANFVPVDDPLAPKVAEFAELEGDIARAFGDRAAAERALLRATVAMAARVADRPSDRREQRSLARCRRKLAEVARATP
jgi:tetratricopeptide (TPR) repeat protein